MPPTKVKERHIKRGYLDKDTVLSSPMDFFRQRIVTHRAIIKNIAAKISLLLIS
jgi:hypothetical protein